MSWNNGYKRKKFEQEQKAQAKEYRKCGMNEEQIQAMYGSHDNTRRKSNGIYPVCNSRTAIIPRRFRTWRSRIRSAHGRCERIQKMLFLSVLPEINNSFDL